MRRTFSVILLLGIVSAGVAFSISPGEVAREQRAEIIETCPRGGITDPGVSESGLMPAQAGRSCLLSSIDLVRFGGPNSAQVLAASDANARQVTVSGRGFHSQSSIAIEIRVYADGALGEPFSTRITSDGTGSFTTSPIKIGCTGLGSTLHIMATDEDGTVDARQVDASTFACS